MNLALGEEDDKHSRPEAANFLLCGKMGFSFP
jgi:hypothetical protein